MTGLTGDTFSRIVRPARVHDNAVREASLLARNPDETAPAETRSAQ